MRTDINIFKAPDWSGPQFLTGVLAMYRLVSTLGDHETAVQSQPVHVHSTCVDTDTPKYVHYHCVQHSQK